MYRNSDIQYGSVAKFLHWLIFILIIGMLTLGFFMDDIPNESVKANAYNIHKLTGMMILVLMLFRLIWTLINPKPLLPRDTPEWQRYAEYLVQGLIYLALIAMPIAGWVLSVAATYPPHLFGYTFNLPIPPDKTVADVAGDIHFYLAWTIIVLISIHALAALYHYFIKRDQILQRMLPGE